MTSRTPLRLWPGVVIAIVLVLARYVVPHIGSDAEIFSMPLAIIGILGGMYCAVAIVVWWLFLSRAPWSERLGVIILMIVSLFATSRIVHESIAGGMMGWMLYVYSIPVLGLALVVGAVATRALSDGVRRAALLAVIVLACLPWTLVRTAGSLGSGSEFHWRWTPTPEQRLLARANDSALESAPAGPKALPPSTAPGRVPASGRRRRHPHDSVDARTCRHQADAAVLEHHRRGTQESDDRGLGAPTPVEGGRPVARRDGLSVISQSRSKTRTNSARF